MTLSNNVLKKIIHEFTERYIEQYQNEFGQLPTVNVDELWRSPCERALVKDNEICWQPVESDKSLTFDNIELALEVTLHIDIKTYFTTLFSESIEATCKEGNFSLLFPWNSDDFQRLQENIIGHIMMKRQLKQPITVFFAVTDEDDTILSINNDSGEVWVERVGCQPHKKIANSLADFLQNATAHFPTK